MKYKQEVIAGVIILSLFSVVFVIAFNSDDSIESHELELNINWSTMELLHTEVDVGKQDHYGYVSVKDFSATRCLFIDGGEMGCMNSRNKFEVLDDWKYLGLMADITLLSNPKDVLVLGVGAGIIPTKLSQDESINIDAVDINKQVLIYANEYFGMTSSEKLKAYSMDARMYLKNTDKTYDVINMDTFKFDSKRKHYNIPPHLTTVEYYTLLKSRLNEDGYLILMLLPYESENRFIGSEYKTLKSVFENVYTFRDDKNVFVASDKEIDFPEDILIKQYESAFLAGEVLYDGEPGVPVY